MDYDFSALRVTGLLHFTHLFFASFHTYGREQTYVYYSRNRKLDSEITLASVYFLFFLCLINVAD